MSFVQLLAAAPPPPWWVYIVFPAVGVVGAFVTAIIPVAIFASSNVKLERPVFIIWLVLWGIIGLAAAIGAGE